MPADHPDNTLVAARDLGIRRDGRWLVHDISLTVAAGEIVSLIGPNGSGKTTTAKALIGLIAADRGSVRRRAGLTIGYVPQRLAVDRAMPLTVARLMSLRRRYPAARVRSALDEVGAADLYGAEVARLSGGELQRVMLARALLAAPDLLVLDEPTANVDAGGALAVYDLVRQARERLGCAVLLISHDLHLVMAETDRVYCLNGHVCCSGTPSVVSESPAYRALFGARAADGLAVYRHHHDHAHLPDGTVHADHAPDA